VHYNVKTRAGVGEQSPIGNRQVETFWLSSLQQRCEAPSELSKCPGAHPGCGRFGRAWAALGNGGDAGRPRQDGEIVGEYLETTERYHAKMRQWQKEKFIQEMRDQWASITHHSAAASARFAEFQLDPAAAGWTIAATMLTN